MTFDNNKVILTLLQLKSFLFSLILKHFKVFTTFLLSCHGENVIGRQHSLVFSYDMTTLHELEFISSSAVLTLFDACWDSCFTNLKGPRESNDYRSYCSRAVQQKIVIPLSWVCRSKSVRPPRLTFRRSI
jgi:hypothetical protein